MKRTVHVTGCDKYELDGVRHQIREHLDRYRKFSDIEGSRVLLKINLLGAMEPEKAVTTHPVFVKAVVLELQERGAIPIIADSPGGLFNATMLKRAYYTTGMTSVSEETGARLNYDTGSHIEKYTGGSFVKSFNVCNYLRNCDLVIALPKIKTHMFCGLTCASKIMFGVVPGMEKVKYHTRFPDTVDFSRMLLDLTELCRVDLFLVDGIIGMDGKGPSRGDPRNIRAIVSGTDHTIIDLQVCRMTGLKPEKTPIMIAAEEQGLITFDQEILVTGDKKGLRLKKAFKPAKGGGIITDPPRYLRDIMVRIATRKPIISHRKCVGCGVCRDNCAGEAITVIKGKARIQYSKCIRCYCCHELCPHGAVYLTINESGLVNYIEDKAYNHFIKV
ncbi:MAG: DUF362 domain-containing protein [Candidatus Thermoplasmatota archaeon]|nr:DUF362 domain-containing protein [Candidatus Thermoplasmatota archaeon]